MIGNITGEGGVFQFLLKKKKTKLNLWTILFSSGLQAILNNYFNEKKYEVLNFPGTLITLLNNFNPCFKYLSFSASFFTFCLHLHPLGSWLALSPPQGAGPLLNATWTVILWVSKPCLDVVLSTLWLEAGLKDDQELRGNDNLIPPESPLTSYLEPFVVTPQRIWVKKGGHRW